MLYVNIMKVAIIAEKYITRKFLQCRYLHVQHESDIKESISLFNYLQDPALDLSTVVMAVSVYLVATNVTTTASVGSPLMSVK